MRPPRATTVLRIVGTIDLIVGILLLLVGAAFVVSYFAPGKGTPPPITDGFIFALFGIVAIWTGVAMAFGGVVVTSSKITTWAVLPHSSSKDDISQIDVVRSDFGHAERVLPVVIRKDGTELKLVPLAWPYRGHWYRKSDKAALTLDHQAKLVSEIRNTLGVGGDHYRSAWPAAGMA